MFAQKPKSIIIQALRIVLVLCAFIFGSQLLFFAFQGGILLTAFWFSVEYFAHNDGAIFCWALQILLLVSLIKEFIANNKTKKGKRKKNSGTILHLFKRCVSLIALYCLGSAAAPTAIECVVNYYRIILLFLSSSYPDCKSRFLSRALCKGCGETKSLCYKVICSLRLKKGNIGTDRWSVSVRE